MSHFDQDTVTGAHRDPLTEVVFRRDNPVVPDCGSCVEEKARTRRLAAVLSAIAAERRRQDAKFPDQHLPNGTDQFMRHAADVFRGVADRRAEKGTLTWRDVLMEEVHEALAETSPERLREELVQVAAVAARWVEDIDQRA